MLEAIASIKASVSGVTYDQFLANREKRQSVAYDIEIIGEAANSIDKSVQEKYPAIPWGDFIGMRNVLIHGYIKTNWQTVWNTATTEMDLLEANLKDIQAAFPWPLPYDMVTRAEGDARRRPGEAGTCGDPRHQGARTS